jgi:hypothetical protein
VSENPTKFFSSFESNKFFSPSTALVAQRSKRRKVEKKSASAFEKLRELKQGGSRNKWATEESTAIYDEVDEDEYTKIVSSRASDWIVDDGELWKTFPL